MGNVYKGISLILFLVQFQLFAINPPSSIGDSNNIILWLHPDTALFTSNGSIAGLGDDVAEWHDISGNGFVFTNSFTNRRPVLTTHNSKRYLNFTPGDFFENTIIKDSINGLDEFSIFITIKSDNADTDNGFMDSENPNGTDDKICLRYDRSGANTGRTRLLKTGMNGNQSSNQVETQSFTQTTNVQVLTLVWKDGERLKVFIDGVLNDSSSSTVAGPLAGVQKIILGKGPKNTSGGLGGGSGWDGLIGEVIFYNKQYNADTIQQISSSISSVESVQSGLWSSPATWDCNCVPEPSYDVTIAPGNSVTLDSSVHVKSLSITAGGSLDLSASNYDIDMSKHLNVNGNLVYREGTVSFSGSEASLITGTFSVYKLDIDKSSALVTTQSGTLNVVDVLNVNTGTFNPNNRTVLVSTASKTARLGEVGGSINGNLRIQRYIDGLTNSIGYRHFSLPIQNGRISDIQYAASGHTGGIYTYGFNGSNKSSAGGYISTYAFSESSAVGAGDFSSGWVAPTSASSTLGYDNAMTFYTGGSAYPSYSLEVSGIPNQGNLSITNLSYSSSDGNIGGGWHLVGNPYASSVDWSQVSKSGVDAIGYVYSESSGAYVATNLLSDQNILAPFQGLFVRVNNSSNSINFSEDDKSDADADFVRSQKKYKRMRFALKSLSNEKFVPAALDFNEESTEHFDSQYDAYKMQNPYNFPSMYFKADTLNLQVSTVPVEALGHNIELFVENYQADSLELTIEEVPEIEGCLRIYDRVENQFIDAKVGETYTFWYDPQMTVANRFVIMAFDQLVNAQEEDLTCFESQDGAIEIELSGVVRDWIVIQNQQDTIIQSNLAQKRLKDLSSGLYQLVWGGTYAGCAVNSKFFSINQPAEVVAEFELNESVALGENLQLSNNSKGAVEYQWNFGLGYQMSYDFEPIHAYEVPGSYEVELISTKNGCNDTLVKKVQVEPGPTGINSINGANQISVYQQGSALHLIDQNQQVESMLMYGLNGQPVGEWDSQEGESLYSVDAIANGIYIVQLRMQDGSVQQQKLNWINP